MGSQNQSMGGPAPATETPATGVPAAGTPDNVPVIAPAIADGMSAIAAMASGATAMPVGMAALAGTVPVPSAAAPPAPLIEPERALGVLFTAAWVAILLGLSVQLTILLVKLVAGASPKLAQIFSDFAGGVSWSVIVCAGVALGTVAARHQAQFMGLLGLLCAPLAWAGAKGAQRGTQWVTGQPLEVLGSLVYEVAAVKAVEYGLLGFFLSKLVRNHASTPQQHALLGLAIGLVFGSMVLGLNIVNAPGYVMALPKLLGLAVNEYLFPVGCSLVIYFVARLSDRGTAMERVVAGGG